ncbi:hypothetical protein ACFV4N_12715 [Actinosynnema sp. NPDC059797]
MVLLLIAAPVVLLLAQEHLWTALAGWLTPPGVHPTLLPEDRPRMTALYLVAAVVFVLPTLVLGFRHAFALGGDLASRPAGRRGRGSAAVTGGLLAVQVLFAMAVVPARRRSPLESWSLDGDLTIAGRTVLEQAFLTGLVGCGAVLVAGIATAVRRGRRRSAVMAVATPVLLFAPVVAFHGGFLA